MLLDLKTLEKDWEKLKQKKDFYGKQIKKYIFIS